MKMKHLTLEGSKEIQQGIEKGFSKTDISRKIGKIPTAVSKEIFQHRTLKPRNRFNSRIICANFRKCTRTKKHCSENCPEYVE